VGRNIRPLCVCRLPESYSEEPYSATRRGCAADGTVSREPQFHITGTVWDDIKSQKAQINCGRFWWMLKTTNKPRILESSAGLYLQQDWSHFKWKWTSKWILVQFSTLHEGNCSLLLLPETFTYFSKWNNTRVGNKMFFWINLTGYRVEVCVECKV